MNRITALNVMNGLQAKRGSQATGVATTRKTSFAAKYAISGLFRKLI